MNQKLCSLQYIQAKCAQGNINQLLSEYAEAEKRVSEVEPSCHVLREYSHFVKTNLEIISRRPEVILQQAVNCRHETAPHIEAQILLQRMGHDSILQDRFPSLGPGNVICNLTHTEGRQVTALALLKDGGETMLICSASSEGTVKLFHPYSAKQVDLLHHDCALVSLVCERVGDGSSLYIAAGATNGRLCVWHGALGESTVQWQKQTRSICEGSPISSLVRCSSGLLCTGGGAGYLIDVRSKDGLRLEAANVTSLGSYDAECLGAAGDGSAVLLYFSDRTVRALPNACPSKPTARQHTHDITAAALVEESNLAAIGFRVPRDSIETVELYAGRISLWDAATLKTVGELEGHTSPVCCLSFSRDGSRLVSASSDWQGPRIWDCLLLSCISCFCAHGVQAQVASISLDGSRAVSGDIGGFLKLWTVPDSEEMTHHTRDNDNHKGTVRHLKASLPDARLLLSAGADKTVRVFERGDQELLELCVQKLHRSDVNRLGVSADGATVATSSDDKSVMVWALDQAHGQLSSTAVLTGHRGWIECVCISSDGLHIASGDSFGEIKVWVRVSSSDGDDGQWSCKHTICTAQDFQLDLDLGIKVTHATGSNIGCQSLALTSNCARMLVSRGDGMVGLYGLDHVEPRFLSSAKAHDITRQDGMVEAFLDLMPDDQTVLSIGDARLRVWDILFDSFQPIHEYPLNGEGRRLAACGDRIAVSCWNGWVYLFQPLPDLTDPSASSSIQVVTLVQPLLTYTNLTVPQALPTTIMISLYAVVLQGGSVHPARFPLHIVAKTWHQCRVDGFVMSAVDSADSFIAYCDDQGHIGVWYVLPPRLSQAALDLAHPALSKTT